MNLSVQYSERVYNALLSLYPVHFRIRFGPEMMQLFRDCSNDALEKGEVAVLVAFWLRVTRDVCISAFNERRRELLAPVNADHPFAVLVDLFLIPAMVTANLAVLGPILTLLIRGGTGIPPMEFMMTSGFFSLVIGSLAVVTSLAMTKLRPTVRLWVKLV